jgi:outer membrane receptor protein involved in Fe transport
MRTTVWMVVAATLAAGLTAHAAASNDQQDQKDPQAKPQTSEGQLAEVVVFGRAEHEIGKADAASEGAVAGADLSVRPMMRVAELLEAVPGLIAAQHSGSGKANQYFLRGFNLDHGTDFTTYVDGMPWNLRSHGHGQGYLDVNGLIPEIVDRIDYRKGPYRADVGDFALAGSSFLTTIDRLEAPFISAESGQYGWGRLAGGVTTALGQGELTSIAQLKTYDGPWQLAEHLRHGSLWSKYVQDIGADRLEVSVSGYHATWRPTEQSPEIAVGTPACPDRFCSLDQTATGITNRWILTGNFTTPDWSATAYAQRYDWHMLSNPTYDYQIRQFDHRWTMGGKAQRQLHLGESVELAAGTEVRYDNASRVGVDHTDAGAFVENLSDNSIHEGSVAAYSEATWHLTDALRVTGGLRADYYHFGVGANAGASPATVGGSDNVSQVSPKAGLAWSVTRAVEVYANWGRGFHSNDARGVVNPVTPVPGLVSGTGKEGGMRFEVGRMNLTAAYWWLDIDSELIFVGDSNAVEPKSGGRRRGLELVAFWKPVSWLGIDAVYTHSHARYKDLQDDPDYVAGDAVYGNLQGYNVEGSVQSAGELGISAVRGPWEASGRLRYLGPYPLVPSGTRRAAAESMVNLRLAYKFAHTMLYGELLNALNDHGNDIRYYYPTFVPGVTPPGDEISTYLSRAEEPRTIRVGIKYSF